jgi:hypothetical protein
LVERAGYRKIARRFEVSEQAVHRHNKEHLPELLAKAHKAQEIAEADRHLDRLNSIAIRIESILDAVEEGEDYDRFFRGAATLRPYLETIAEISKVLDRRPQLNILIAPVVREAIVEALHPYPEARLAVADALDSLDSLEAAG